ncbi:MAG: hypothetical protein E6626_17050, partial [Flavonifractor plautii]|nr:hypothetical protein [Flavonifractor plautii]MDU6292558.1 hypothetical protein [Flavonifractor plautii]MDU6345054.1 hypothetical protein [Flavonifractor plautii]
LDFLLLNFEPEGRMTPLTGEETMQFSGDRDIKGRETESKGLHGRRMVDIIKNSLGKKLKIQALCVAFW